MDFVVEELADTDEDDEDEASEDASDSGSGLDYEPESEPRARGAVGWDVRRERAAHAHSLLRARAAPRRAAPRSAASSALFTLLVANDPHMP